VIALKKASSFVFALIPGPLMVCASPPPSLTPLSMAAFPSAWSVIGRRSSPDTVLGKRLGEGGREEGREGERVGVNML